MLIGIAWASGFAMVAFVIVRRAYHAGRKSQRKNEPPNVIDAKSLL